MSERDLWDTAKNGLSPFGLLLRVENSCEKGTFDVCYLLRRYPKVAPVSGWLELKYVPKLPAKGTTVRIDHLTKDQVLFGEAWRNAGGRAWMLLQIENHYLLLTVSSMRAIYEGGLDGPSLLRTAYVHRHRSLPVAEIVKCLTET